MKSLIRYILEITMYSGNYGTKQMEKICCNYNLCYFDSTKPPVFL